MFRWWDKTHIKALIMLYIKTIFKRLSLRYRQCNSSPMALHKCCSTGHKELDIFIPMKVTHAKRQDGPIEQAH